MALKGKFGRGASSGSWVKGPDGKFNGSLPSAGKKLVTARARLAAASARLREAQAGASKNPSLWSGSLRIAQRAQSFHQKAVAKAEQRVQSLDRGPLQRSATFASERAAAASSRVKALKLKIGERRKELRGVQSEGQKLFDGARARGASVSAAMAASKSARDRQLAIDTKIGRLKRALKVHQRQQKRLSSG